MHDPAWWWVKASNLGGLGGPVVRFNLAHGFVWFKLLGRDESIGRIFANARNFVLTLVVTTGA